MQFNTSSTFVFSCARRLVARHLSPLARLAEGAELPLLPQLEAGVIEIQLDARCREQRRPRVGRHAVLVHRPGGRVLTATRAEIEVAVPVEGKDEAPRLVAGAAHPPQYTGPASARVGGDG